VILAPKISKKGLLLSLIHMDLSPLSTVNSDSRVEDPSPLEKSPASPPPPNFQKGATTGLDPEKWGLGISKRGYY
jgi:hypothetical protein